MADKSTVILSEAKNPRILLMPVWTFAAEEHYTNTKTALKGTASEGAEKVFVLKGRDFSRVESSMISMVALATEGMFLGPTHLFSTLFSRGVSAGL